MEVEHEILTNGISHTSNVIIEQILWILNTISHHNIVKVLWIVNTVSHHNIECKHTVRIFYRVFF